MAHHHVYANNNEIASKKAKGKSNAEMPNVCYTTPMNVAAGTPLPFANTCDAKDLTKVSKSVLIKGGGIALENKSYFKKSTGDEASNFKKGIISGKKNSKGFFQGWSPNVKVEGKGVARHDDIVTHNHSNPPNALPNRYNSIVAKDGECEKDKKRIDKRCKVDDDDNKGKAKSKRKPNNENRSKNDKATNWSDKYCGPLKLKPGLKNFEEFQKQFGDLDAMMDQAADILKSDVLTKLETEVTEFATKKAIAFGARRAATGWIPVVGWVVSAVDLVATGYDVATTVTELKNEVKSLKESVEKLKESSKKVTDVFAKHKDSLDKFQTLSKEDQTKIANEIMATSQEAYANADPCLRARKCALVTYTKSKASSSGTAKDKAKTEGCCPGQTGHHILPDAMFRATDQDSTRKAWAAEKADRDPAKMPRAKKKTAECWSDYKEGPAPTICVEGGATYGSHGMFHDETEKLIKRARGKSPEIEYETARNKVTGLTARKYGCNKKCLDAQLDDYYKKAHSCPGSLDDQNVVAHTGKSGGAPKTKVGGRKKN